MATPAPSPASTVPEPTNGQVYYFAYGSNMNARVLTGRRNVVPVKSLPAVLDGYVLGFHLRGVPYVEPGMATVTPANPTAQKVAAAKGLQLPIQDAQEAYEARLAVGGVHGVVHLISAADWEQVKATEGVRIKNVGYQVIEVECRTYDGQKVKALTLEAAPISVGDIRTFLPSQRYLGLIREGAKEMGVDPAYCAMLDAHPAYEPLEGLPGKVAKSAVTGIGVGLALPLIPVFAAAIAYRAATNVLSTGRPTPAPVKIEERPAPGPLASAVRPSKSEAALTQQVADAAAKESTPSAGAPSNVKPAPQPAGAFGAFFATLRKYVDPRVMSLSFLAIFRGIWVAHDLLLAFVLGSGKDNKRRPATKKAD